MLTGPTWAGIFWSRRLRRTVPVIAGTPKLSNAVIVRATGWRVRLIGRWREVTQDREVPAAWVGRDPLYPWEAKVYTVVPVP